MVSAVFTPAEVSVSCTAFLTHASSDPPDMTCAVLPSDSPSLLPSIVTSGRSSTASICAMPGVPEGTRNDTGSIAR